MSINIVKALKTTLKSPLTTTATSVVLTKFWSSKEAELALSNFGDWGVIVIKQGDNIEMIKFSAVTQSSSDDSCTLTVATNGRHLNPTTPYAGSGTGLAFQSGAECIITNDPYTMSQFGNLNNAQTWVLLQTFTVTPKSNGGTPTEDTELATKAYVDATATGSTNINRIVVAATAGATIADGNLVYFDDTDNEWKLSDADTATTVENVQLGIAQGAGTDGVAITNGVLLFGVDDAQTGMTAGDIMYASNTAGGISASAGTKEVTVGIAKSATELYFCPRYNQQLTEDQQDALAGSSGTPSATNKYITADDVSDAAGSAKIVRATGTALPALSGANLTSLPEKILNIDVITASGTWTRPAGVTQVKVRVLAGGGGGGYMAAGGAANGAGGGGGAGQYVEAEVVVSGNVTVTVGAAGVGGVGSVPTAATAGGDSVFAGDTTITADGGSGGGNGSNGGLGAGGAGGSTGAIGDMIINGQAGEAGTQYATAEYGGVGGSSCLGQGGYKSISTSADGKAASGYGAGGSGASGESAGARDGGAGTQGVVIVEYVV